MRPMDVAIRPYEPGDAPALHEAALESVESIHPWMSWCHPGFRLEEAQAWVERQVPAFQSGEQFEFVIVSGEGTLLGACGLNQIDRANRRANLGYWVRSSAAGKGVATAAVSQLVRWAFRNTDLQRLEVLAATTNLASLRVAEKTGAVREGVLRSRLMLLGKACDAVMFSFVRGADPPA